MKKFFSITMTILFLLVSFQQALIIVHFKLNQNIIEKEFCVNKAKPKMQCHGQCHLKKELEKSDKNSDLNDSKKKQDELNKDFKDLQKELEKLAQQNEALDKPNNFKNP